MESCQEVAKKFYCKDCDYITSKTSSWKKHLLTSKHQNTIKQYKSPFARICPFIVSKGRANMAKIMEPYKETIVKIHTDGFISSEIAKDIKLSYELGVLVCEGLYNHIKIINNSKSGNLSLADIIRTYILSRF
jgi:hypothetical protein